jgi:hypothetical protein
MSLGLTLSAGPQVGSGQSLHDLEEAVAQSW